MEAGSPSVLRLRENLEVLAVDDIVIVYQPIAGSLHFSSDLFLCDSIAEHAGEEPTRMEIEDCDATDGP